MEKHEFTIDDVTYSMSPINAIPAWNALKKAATLLRGVELTQGSNQSAAVGALLANLGDPVVADIEKLVMEHTVATVGGDPYKLSVKSNEHFNKYRAHMLQVLIEGVKYQFAPFFAGGAGLFASLIPAK